MCSLRAVATKHVCARCGTSLDHTYFEMSTRGGTSEKCLRCAVIHAPLVKRALKTALVVGTVLTTINQLDMIVAQGVTGRVAFKVGLTFIVPFVVTTWGALSNARRFC
jgi:hypothetical protein